jgi:hypothetical protein
MFGDRGDSEVDYKNELLDALVGKPVVVGLVKAPDLDEEAVESMREDPAFGTKEPVQSVRASFELVGYDGIGVTLRMLVEGERPFLVPWSAVLKIEDGFEDHEEFVGY